MEFVHEPRIIKKKHKANNNYLKILLIGFFLLAMSVYLISSFAIQYTEEIKNVEIQSMDYPNPGSWHINKSAKWVGLGKAEVVFDIDSIMKREEGKYQDIILVLDISGSMYGSKLDRLKSDSIELIETLLSNNQNKVAIVTFESNSGIKSDFTNNKEYVFDVINSLHTGGTTNYNAALLSVDKIMRNYIKESNREVLMLFLTDGYPNEDIPNQVATYELLKDKYPYMTINGVQYEMGKSIIKEIIDVSDNQWVADQSSLNNVLFEVLLSPFIYEKFEVTDYIHDEYFYINSIDDIKVPYGEVKLEEENGVQKVTWILDNLYRTGTNLKMHINLTMKEQYLGIDGFYPTNKREMITSKLPDDEQVAFTSDKTPVLKTLFNVIYENNTPEGCNLEKIESEKKAPYEKVTKKDIQLYCEGYTFKGWQIADDIKMINDDIFAMPFHDVLIRGTWGKHSLVKSMDGTVKVISSATFDIGQNVNSKMKSVASQANQQYTSSDALIKKIKRSDVLPDDFVPTSDNTVSTSESDVPIYIWFNDENGIMYYYTEASDGNLFLNTDSSYIFYNFNNLTSLDLSELDTSSVTNMSHMFHGCSSLTSLDLSELNTSSVTNMSHIFHSCRGITSLDLSELDTSSVTNMSGMFSDCIGLTSLDLSELDTSGVTNMSSMFSGCSGLTSLDLNDLNTNSVTNMSSMFNGCRGLTSLDLSDLNISSVTNMSSMFSGCRGLTSLDLSDLDTGSVTNMSYMFSDCSGLTNLDLSDLDTGSVTNMNSMFSGCSSLTSLDLSDLDTGSVTTMTYMFYSCSSLASLDLSDFDTGSLTNMSYIFCKCNRLLSVDLSNLDTSNVTNMSYMFYSCTRLASLDLSELDTSSVTNMSSMFGACGSLTGIDLSNLDTSSVTNMRYMFSGCSHLTILDLNSFDTGKVKDMTNMFSSCGMLVTIYVSDLWSTKAVSNGADMFLNCQLIVGGNGTVYNSQRVNKKMAVIDTPAIDDNPAIPGYLTYKNHS